nr:hypothetical protein [Tanacetum cinerariifolium]
PQTPEDSEDEGDGKDDLDLNIGEEERHDEEEEEEEEEDELYRDVNINQGKGLQATLEVEDTHVTLTTVKLDGQQESSSVSSQFVTSMLNLTLNVGMESIFETTSRIYVQTPTSVTPLPITTPTMTSSTIATTTTTSQAPILPTTILSDIIQNFLSFGSLFRFDDRLRSLEENFYEVMQTNQFAGVVSAIPRIIQHYMDQRMNEAVKVVVQIQSDWLHEQRNLYKALVDAYESDKIILDAYGEIVTLKRRRDDDEDNDKEPFAGPDRGSKRRREGKEPESASAPSETATRSAGRVDTLTPKLLVGPTYDLMKGSCKSLIELEYHLEEVYKATTAQLDWVNP